MLPNRGITITLVLVFGFIFIILLSAILGLVLSQLRFMAQRLAFEQALHLAESGVQYFEWCLQNNIADNCQITRSVADLQGQAVGQSQITAVSSQSCGQTTSWQITATGWTNNFPQAKRKVQLNWGRKSVGEYAFLLNSNVWVGSDVEINGLYHSNGGVRMDGENKSLVTSAVKDWVCTSSFGCSVCPVTQGCRLENNQCWCPGVFGGGQNPNLWRWPEPSFDFNRITVDLAQMKTQAQSSGVYLPPSVNLNPQGKGWHLVFKNNGTFDAFIITRLRGVLAFSLEEGWHTDYFIIDEETFYRNFSQSLGCGVVLVEDNLWPEGVITQKIAVASADLTNPNRATQVVLRREITYGQAQSSGLTLISQSNILIAPDSPNVMDLKGIYVAQLGRFSRNHYPNNIRDSLDIIGSIVSNGRVGTKWSSGSQMISGYRKREIKIDTNLVFNPPAFTPAASIDFQASRWQER